MQIYWILALGIHKILQQTALTLFGSIQFPTFFRIGKLRVFFLNNEIICYIPYEYTNFVDSFKYI